MGFWSKLVPPDAAGIVTEYMDGYGCRLGYSFYGMDIAIWG
ncbi:MAG TPA: hypothetical protein V6D14_04790 [Coleofasciculaceae cyanobacterium]